MASADRSSSMNGPQTVSKVRAQLRTLRGGEPDGGILRLPLSALRAGDLVASGAGEPPVWSDLYFELFKGASPHLGMQAPTALLAAARPYFDKGVVPLAIADYRYESVRPGAAKLVPQSDDRELGIALRDGVDSKEAFVPSRTFFATALGHDEPGYFLPQTRTPTLCGPTVRFVLDPKFYLTNGDVALSDVRIDFGDEGGLRPVALNAMTDINYRDAGTKTIRLTAQGDGRSRETTFQVEVLASSMPPFDEHWTGLEYATDPDGTTATGHAWVFYGTENGTKHAGIVNPIIISEGFPGNYSLSYLWWSLTSNAQGLATTLLQSGMDLIILGYDVGTTRLEANAGVVVACIQKAISERQGDAELVVGGACMGGVIARYALAYMEKNSIAHDTSLYFSIDSPHMGINAPAGVQYMLGLFSEFSSTAETYYAKLQEPAAQELLLYSANYFFEDPSTPSSARTSFMQNLAAIGQFPSTPTKIGIADGIGTGASDGVPASTQVFTGEAYGMYAAPGGLDALGLMFSAYDVADYFWVDCPFSCDGAPGSIEPYFQAAAQAAGTTANYADCTFVPTISALSMSGLDIYTNGGLYAALDGSNPPQSDLDHYMYNTANMAHMKITPAMATWLLAYVTPSSSD